jgi:hypothetical protein
MITVGNIITKESITGIPSNFGVYETVPTTDIPNLIIGWELTKTLYPEVSILRKKIKDNLYWTFSPIEKRSHFENDLKKYIDKSYKDYIIKIKFHNIDPIIYKINTVDELLSKLSIVAGGFTYLYVNKVVYVYHDFVIYSIDLELLDFIGFDRKIILSTLKETTNFSDCSWELKNFKSELKYLDIKYLPYLIYKDATKNTTSSLVPQG